MSEIIWYSSFSDWLPQFSVPRSVSLRPRFFFFQEKGKHIVLVLGGMNGLSAALSLPSPRMAVDPSAHLALDSAR